MAVFRVERNKGYTVMSNHHLRNKELERAGYIVRSRERDEKGRLRGADYVTRRGLIPQQ